MKTNIAQVAKTADAAWKVCGYELLNAPRDLVRRTAERRLLVQLAAKVNGLSVDESLQALEAEEAILYDAVIQDLKKANPKLAAWDDRKVQEPKAKAGA